MVMANLQVSGHLSLHAGCESEVAKGSCLAKLGYLAAEVDFQGCALLCQSYGKGIFPPGILFVTQEPAALQDLLGVPRISDRHQICK